MKRPLPLVASALALLLAGLAACHGPQRPADLPYRTGTVELHADGSFAKGKLVEPTTVEGLPCRRWVHRWENGALRGVQLGRDHVVAGNPLPAGTFLWFDLEGRLETAWLSEDRVLDGVPCNGGGKIAAGFHPNGRLRTVFLAEDAEIQGVACEASVFRPVRFDPDGRFLGQD